MKKLRLWLATIAVLLCSVSVSAHDFEVNGIYYNITSETDLMVEVTYQGNYVNTYNKKDYIGEVVIPESISYNGNIYSVTSIGEKAFECCSGLTSVTIPNSVTSIGNEAFDNCDGLTSVTIGNSVTSIGGLAFRGCSGLTSITIPNSVTSIGEYAFEDCNGLTSVTIGNSVRSIGYKTFTDCSSLTSITIPNSVTSIGGLAFYGCSSLTSITIPNSVTSIGGSAFHGCSGLTSITIPNSVTSIGDDAFSWCTGLTSITIPNSVTSIESGAFSGCTGLTNITVDENNTTYDSRDNCNAIIETGSNELVVGCKSTVIPNSVTSIGDDAFYGCSGLTSITIGNSVTSIGEYAFSWCTGLTSITIPNSVTSIESGAFSCCTGLTSITIGNSVTSIGADAFGATGWWKNQADGVVYMDYILLGYKGKTPTGVIEIKDGTRIIGNSAFSSCSGLTSITFPNSVTSIGEYAFSSCSSLTSVTIGNSVTSIGDDAFEATGWWKNQADGVVYMDYILLGYKGKTPTGVIEIKDDTRIIGNSAFSSCSGLTSITIPNSVRSIGDYAFYECSNLASITNHSELLIEKGSTSNGHIGYYANNVTNIVGDYLFENSDGVNYLINYDGDDKNLTLPENCKGYDYVIKSDVFYGCSDLVSITIPDSIESIPAGLFDGCTTLKEVYIGNSVKDIPTAFFKDCVALVKLYIGNSVTSIPTNLLSNCTTLEKLYIGNSVTSIPTNLLSNCTALEKLYIGNSVTNIGENLLNKCSDLNVITVAAIIPPSVNDLGLEYQQYFTVKLQVPEGSKAMYQFAEGWKKFFNIEEYDPTGIAEITPDAEDKNLPIYNLQGARMTEDKENLPTGIYIQGGKKIFIK